MSKWDLPYPENIHKLKEELALAKACGRYGRVERALAVAIDALEQMSSDVEIDLNIQSAADYVRTKDEQNEK